MMNNFRRSIYSVFTKRTVCSEIYYRTLHNYVNITSQVAKFKYKNPQGVSHETFRYKSQKKYDSDDEDIVDQDTSLAKDSKLVRFGSTSMRTDMVLKSALGVARNKIEQAFYESKIRVNGRKITKKSASVRIGDEIDVIKMVSPKNPDHLYVSRIEILDAVPKEDTIAVSARRFKNLLIENYEEDPHKGGSSDNN